MSRGYKVDHEHECLDGRILVGDTWWEYDGRGIELCRVCSRCRAQKLARYRPEVLRHYTELDIDEPIEEDC